MVLLMLEYLAVLRSRLAMIGTSLRTIACRAPRPPANPSASSFYFPYAKGSDCLEGLSDLLCAHWQSASLRVVGSAAFFVGRV